MNVLKAGDVGFEIHDKDGKSVDIVSDSDAREAAHKAVVAKKFWERTKPDGMKYRIVPVAIG